MLKKLSVSLVIIMIFIISGELTFNLDVGNDDYYEFSESWQDSEVNPQIPMTWLDETGEFYATAISCDCLNCVKITGAQRFCRVPITLKDVNHAGTLVVKDPVIGYLKKYELKNVSYSQVFPRNNGGCFRVEYGSEPTSFHQFSIPEGLTCNQDDIINYTADDHNPPETKDAIVDAAYRLMNETLDDDEDGVLDDFNPDNADYHTISAEGQFRGQSLWGPIEVKLITWI